MANDLTPCQRHLMTSHNTLRCVDGCIVTKPVKFWAVWSIFTEVMRKPCFMASIVLPWQRQLKKSQNCLVDVFTAGLLTHVKFEHFLSIFIGVIATSSFMARDFFPYLWPPLVDFDGWHLFLTVRANTIEGGGPHTHSLWKQTVGASRMQVWTRVKRSLTLTSGNEKAVLLLIDYQK